jgi:hypothetical protein
MQHQHRHATSTYSPLQAIKGLKNNERSGIKIPCHSSLVVIFWSCFGRCHSRLEPVVGLLALPISPMGWLYAEGKFIIYGLCFPINHTRLNKLIVTRILSSFFLGIQSRRDCRHAILQLIGNCPQQMATTV